MSKKISDERQIFATALALVIQSPKTAVAELTSFATELEYPGSSVAGQLNGFEILSPKHLTRRL